MLWTTRPALRLTNLAEATHTSVRHLEFDSDESNATDSSLASGGVDEDEWIAQEYADNPWKSRWIPILDRGGDSLAAGLDSDSRVTPLIAVGWETMPSQWPRFPSITALVDMYIDVIRNHATWSPLNRGWEIELTELTPIQRSFC